MNEVKKSEIRVKILRFNELKDEEPTYKTYNVPFVEGTSVLNVLNYIYENIDSSISYFCSCRIGLCGRCDMIVNGEAVQACTTISTRDMTIEPLRVLGFETVKDLVASHVLLSDRDKLFLPRANTFHRFNSAFAKAQASTPK